MRDIKFRAYQDGLWLFSETGLNYDLSMFFGRLFGHAKIMQFTGLTDENGKDIYEGDILKVNGEIDVSENPFRSIERCKFELISKVVYNDLMACFELETIDPDINVQHWEFYGEGTECFEVIGNIHEKDKL